MRLVDADDFVGKFDMSPLVQEALRKALNHMPTVDAVPVVRCKDCAYWDATEKVCVDMMTADENGFCSWGERREDEIG